MKSTKTRKRSYRRRLRLR
uniref:Uncharacterized protein n=1 Tax=Anguilla anguilla TaxID=7936 RepID=A0A0E9U7S9_ANGAN